MLFDKGTKPNPTRGPVRATSIVWSSALAFCVLFSALGKPFTSIDWVYSLRHFIVFELGVAQFPFSLFVAIIVAGLIGRRASVRRLHWFILFATVLITMLFSFDAERKASYRSCLLEELRDRRPLPCQYPFDNPFSIAVSKLFNDIPGLAVPERLFGDPEAAMAIDAMLKQGPAPLPSRERFDALK